MTEKLTTSYVIVFTAFLFFICLPPAAAQRIAVISPEKNDQAPVYAERLSAALSGHFRMIETSAADSAFSSLSMATPFNQTIEETRSAGKVIGADILIFVKVETQRRSSFTREKYHEATAAIFVTGARSGELFHFELRSIEEDTQDEAFRSLLNEAEATADALNHLFPDIYQKELAAVQKTEIEDHSSIAEEDKTTRPPMPYRQVKPSSTSDAFLYGVHATIDAQVDITAQGSIAKIRIIRWAGYGLEKAVTDAIRKMKWRPAERNGKNLPMRVMLRYNFTKLEKNESN